MLVLVSNKPKEHTSLHGKKFAGFLLGVYLPDDSHAGPIGKAIQSTSNKVDNFFMRASTAKDRAISFLDNQLDKAVNGIC